LLVQRINILFSEDSFIERLNIQFNLITQVKWEIKGRLRSDLRKQE